MTCTQGAIGESVSGPKGDLTAPESHFRLAPQDGTPVGLRVMSESANSGLMQRNKFVLFATSLPRLNIGCAITGLIAPAVESRRQACRRLVERRFLGGEAEP